MKQTNSFLTSMTLQTHNLKASGKVLVADMAEYDVVHIKPDVNLAIVSDSELRETYDRFTESVGRPIDIAEGYEIGGAPTGERWSDIRYREDIPDMAAFRHSKNAQPLHTDESYVSSSIGVMLFYCVHAAPRGGETTFVGGFDLLDYLNEREPDLLERLLSVPVQYQKAGDSKTRPIIELLENKRPTFNFNYYCVEPEQDAAALQLNEDFFDFCQNRLPKSLIKSVSLQRGEGAAWKDHLVLHGRNSFDAVKTDDRLIFKTGVILEQIG